MKTETHVQFRARGRLWSWIVTQTVMHAAICTQKSSSKMCVLFYPSKEMYKTDYGEAI